MSITAEMRAAIKTGLAGCEYDLTETESEIHAKVRGQEWFASIHDLGGRFEIRMRVLDVVVAAGACPGAALMQFGLDTGNTRVKMFAIGMQYGLALSAERAKASQP
jgi:hypothetical protein